MSVKYLNGVALNGAGWYLLEESKPFPGFARRRRGVAAPGMFGTIPESPDRDAPVILETIRCSPSARDDLEALLDSDTLILSNDTIEALVELEVGEPQHFTTGDDEVWADYRCTFRVPGVYFRSKTATTSTPASINAASVDVSVLSGISGRVTDAILRVKGAVSGLRVEAGSSFVTFGDAVESNEYLRIDTGARTAHVTTSDTWTGGTDVTGDLDWGPGFYPLVIAPVFSDPATRAGKLTVKTTSRSGAAIEVRAKGAYVSADL